MSLALEILDARKQAASFFGMHVPFTSGPQNLVNPTTGYFDRTKRLPGHTPFGEKVLPIRGVGNELRSRLPESAWSAKYDAVARTEEVQNATEAALDLMRRRAPPSAPPAPSAPVHLPGATPEERIRGALTSPSLPPLPADISKHLSQINASHQRTGIVPGMAPSPGSGTKSARHLALAVLRDRTAA